nr:unnamed protein product [Callosobruchus analis]
MGSHPARGGNRITNRCIHCNKTFVFKRTLDDHIVKRHPDFIASVSRKVHECTKCSFKTVSTNYLKRHMVSHQNIAHTRITHKCIYCNKTLSSKQALDDHILNRHPDFIASVSGKVHECTECTYKTVFISQLRGHMAKHPDVAHKYITNRCIYCNKTFASTRSLNDHIVKTHPDFIASVKSKIHECTQCTYKTTISKRIREHLIAKHPEIADNHIFSRCIYCNNTFTCQRVLDDHIVKRHPDFIASVSRKVHECTKCAFKTVRPSRLKEHIKVKHPDRDGNRCIYCNKTFVQKQTLDDHIVKTHPDFIASVNSKIYECIQCTYKTTISKDIREHLMSKHHQIADNHIFIRCIYCNDTFVSKPSLDDHIVKRHPDFIASVSRKIHECTNCTFKTIRASRFKEHIKAKHPDIAGDRLTNNCIYCNKTFVRKITLNDHIVKRHPDFKASVGRTIHECTNFTKNEIPSKDQQVVADEETDGDTFICYHCQYATGSKRHLIDHMNLHKDSKHVYSCYYCDFRTNSSILFTSHTRTHSSESTQFGAIHVKEEDFDDICQANATHPMVKHPDVAGNRKFRRLTSVSSRVHECTKCTFKTTSTSQLRRHAVTHDTAGNRITIRCIYCNKTFTTKQKLDEHIIKTHPDFIASVSSKVHECTECTYKTTNNCHMKQHMVKHADVADNRITNRCIYCNKTFKGTRSLDNHVIRIHTNFIASVSSKVHECTECTYKTVFTRQLRRHMVNHPDVTGNHISNRCIHCNKTFKTKQKLDDHIIKKHPDFIAFVTSKVHECTECTYKTTDNSHLKQHMAKHPDVAGNHIPNRCIHCNKAFTTKKRLDDHIIKKHPDFISSVSSKVHECTECTYKTTDNSNLEQHMAKHPDIAGNHIPNRCIHCNKAFTTKKRLDDHIIKKHPDFISSVSSKVHECTECTYKTTDNSNLKQHMLKHPDIADGNRITNRCILCNKTFVSRRTLDDHIVKRHPDFIASVSRKVHECTKCTFKTVVTKNEIPRKDQQVVDDEETDGDTFACCHCQYTTGSKRHLIDHMNLHKDSKHVYSCYYCDFRTNSTILFTSHTRTHSSESTQFEAIYVKEVDFDDNFCQTFTRKLALEDHVVKRHPDFIASVSKKIYQCSKCTFKTVSTKDLKRHIMDIAGNRITIRCIYCNKIFTTKQRLDDHIIKAHPDFIASVSSKVHECTQCTYKTTDNSHLKQHMVKHADVADNHITNGCIYCNKTFKGTRSLDDHILRIHPDFIASVSSKVHECTECTYKTVFTGQLRRHMVNHSDLPGNHISNRCIHCNKIFTTKQRLDDHIIKSHPDFMASVTSKVHGCTECSFITTNNSHMKHHIAKHPAIAGNMTNRCIHCNKTFTTKQKLDEHILKTHPDFIASVSSKVHECTECTYKTTNNSHMKQHMVKHPDIAGNHITTRCIHCNKTFTTKQRLDDHIIKTHLDFIASVSSKVHNCTKCTYKTTSNSHLKRHMAKHSDIAGNRITIRCNYCNKTFTSTQALDDHILNSHPDFIVSVSSKIHECTKCSYKTTITTNLNRHNMTKHPEALSSKLVQH